MLLLKEDNCQEYRQHMLTTEVDSVSKQRGRHFTHMEHRRRLHQHKIHLLQDPWHQQEHKITITKACKSMMASNSETIITHLNSKLVELEVVMVKNLSDHWDISKVEMLPDHNLSIPKFIVNQSRWQTSKWNQILLDLLQQHKVNSSQFREERINKDERKIKFKR